MFAILVILFCCSRCFNSSRSWKTFWLSVPGTVYWFWETLVTLTLVIFVKMFISPVCGCWCGWRPPAGPLHRLWDPVELLSQKTPGPWAEPFSLSPDSDERTENPPGKKKEKRKRFEEMFTLQPNRIRSGNDTKNWLCSSAVEPERRSLQCKRGDSGGGEDAGTRPPLCLCYPKHTHTYTV